MERPRISLDSPGELPARVGIQHAEFLVQLGIVGRLFFGKDATELAKGYIARKKFFAAGERMIQALFDSV